MSAVPFVTELARSGSVVYADDRRLVAVAVDAAELVRPGSDLARMLATVPRADLLLATDGPLRPRPRPVLAPPPLLDIDDLPPVELDEHALAEAEPESPTVALSELNLPGLRLHRLDLRVPLTGQAEDDLVAALSELVGFDPEPGVACLAPIAVDAESAVVSRAAQRIAQVYGLPLLRFRCIARTTTAATGA